MLCLALLLAFALSGHATAVPSSQIWYSLGSDLLHLVGETIWVGGLFSIGVKVQDKQNHAVPGAAILIELTMLDMDMGTQTAQLLPVTTAPGSYAGQSDLTMAGHWQVIVRLLPPN